MIGFTPISLLFLFDRDLQEYATVISILIFSIFLMLFCYLLIEFTFNKKVTFKVWNSSFVERSLPLLRYHSEESKKPKCRLIAICGQSVSQKNGELNIHLRKKFLEVSSKGDYAIFAGTPQEKDVFFEGYKPFENFKCGDVTLNLYNLDERTICCLKEHHSRKSIHNCVEVLWSIIALKSIKEISWTSVHGLMYDRSQCVRTSRILCLENEHYENYIQENTKIFQRGAPFQQCQENKERLRTNDFWTQKGCDTHNLFKKATQTVSIIMTDSCFLTMIEIFSNVSQCYHIGSLDKQAVENNLVWKWGAGYNYGDLCDLLPNDFTMDGNRQKGSSDSE